VNFVYIKKLMQKKKREEKRENEKRENRYMFFIL